MSDKDTILLISPFDQGVAVNEQRRRVNLDSDGTESKPTQQTTQQTTQQNTQQNTQQTKTKSSKPSSQITKPSRKVVSLDSEEEDIGLGVSGDIRIESQQQNINVVAATRAHFENEKKNGNVFREDQMEALENNLEDQIEELLDAPDVNAWDRDEFLQNYQKAVKLYMDTVAPEKLINFITTRLLTVEGVTTEIRTEVENVIASRRVEIDPVGISDIQKAGWNYLGEVLKSFGVFAKDQLSGDILDDSGDSCLYSHPYVTAFALLSGFTSGGLTTGPLWSRLLSTVAAPVPQAPLKLAMATDRALARTVDKLPFYIGTASKATRYGVYGAILASVTGTVAATLALPDDAKELNEFRSLLNEKIESLVGTIPLGFLAGGLSTYLSKMFSETTKEATGLNVRPEKFKKTADSFVDANKTNIEKATREGILTWSKEQVDSLTSQMPLTRKEMGNMISAEVVEKLETAASVSEKERGNMSSMNCYLLTVGGSFALTNLARGPLKSASFSTRVAIDQNWNKLTNLMDTSYRSLRTTRGGLFRLKKGNDLAAYLALRAILENRTVGKVLGDVRISGKLDARPTLVIQTSGGTGAGYVVNNKVVQFSLGYVTNPRHRAQLKAFTKQIERPNGTKMDVVQIDMANANRQLREEVSAPVFERVQTELSKEVDTIYKTGTTITRIRELASKIDSLNMSPAQVMNQHYKNTAALMTRMMTRSKDGVRVFEKSLTEIEKRTKEIRAALKNINISPDDVIAATKKYEIENPTGPVANFRLIAKYLPADVRADQLFRAAIGKSTRTKYDKLIDNILELDTLEKQMITEFKMIDEMFSLEKRMHQKFGTGDALVDIPPNFDDYISGKRGLGNKLVNYSRELLILYNRFSSYLEKSVFARSGRLLRTGMVKTVYLMADAEWAARRMGPPLMQTLRSINLRNISQAFKEDPKLTAAIASAGVVSLYDFIDFLINYLSGAINENVESLNKNDMANFIKFLKAFKQKTRKIRNRKKAKPWIAWVRDFNSIGAVSAGPRAENLVPFKQKMTKLFKLFKDMVSVSTVKNDTLKENRIITMKKTDLRKLVSELLNENTGMGYSKYPYHSEEYSEDEPDEDYMSEWKILVDSVCGQKKKNVDGDPTTIEDTAVEVAKLLVKDSELFREVLELAGANKSVGREIMNQLKAVKDKSMVDKQLKV